jgi:hypothetical protein
VKKLLNVFAALAVCTIPASRAGAQQLPADTVQPVARVEGILHVGEFLGPPNYGGSPSTDARETRYYLQLPAPVGEQNPNLIITNIFEKATEHFMQLQLNSPALVKRARLLVGKKVVVNGPIEPSMVGHDRTGIILTVQSIALVRDWSW